MDASICGRAVEFLEIGNYLAGNLLEAMKDGSGLNKCTALMSSQQAA